jgi:hypothetical protein
MPLDSIPCARQDEISQYEVVPRRGIDPVLITGEVCDAAKSLTEKFFALTPSTQSLLRLAIYRLMVSQHRSNLAEAVTDLGIAIESTFLEETDREEITFRLSLRAARFLDDDLDARRLTRRMFVALYALRSRAVHRGTIPAQIDGVPEEYSKPSVLLAYGFARTVQAIRTIIESWQPNWTDLVLN